jgi:hypothetical protein
VKDALAAISSADDEDLDEIQGFASDKMLSAHLEEVRKQLNHEGKRFF